MDNRLSEEKLNILLPSLSLLADNVSEENVINDRVLSEIAIRAGLDKQEWAINELKVWAEILEIARNNYDNIEETTILGKLDRRGVPWASARLAYIKIKPKPFKVLPSSINFGRLKVDARASKTLEVTGGIVKEIVFNKNRLNVAVLNKIDGKTLVQVSMSKGNAGESFRDVIILRNDKGELQVSVAAEWEEQEKEPPQLSYCPICKIPKKSLFWNFMDKKYECLNLKCKATGSSIDKLYSPYK